MIPGFDDPALASLPPAGNLYFGADTAVAAKSPGELIAGRNGRGQAADTQPVSLIFGNEETHTSQGEAVVSAADSSRGHFSEILNFHGSPAPWILIGLLLAAGFLHLEANAKFKGKL